MDTQGSSIHPTAAGEADDENLGTTEVAVTFRTALPEQYAVSEEIQIQLSSNSVAKEISDVVK